MEMEEFHDLIDTRLGGLPEVNPDEATHAVVSALVTRLSPDEAEELALHLSQPLADLLAMASGEKEFDRDDFIEDVAARLDLDDVDAERVALAVLGAIRSTLEPAVLAEEVIEALPSDLARLMQTSL